MRPRDVATLWAVCAAGFGLLAGSGDPSEWPGGDPIPLGVIDRAIWGATMATGLVGVIGVAEIVTRLRRRFTNRKLRADFPVDLPNDVEPVTTDNPLVGIETIVLKTWLENSPSLRKAYRSNPQDRARIENLARLRYIEKVETELELRGQGLTQAEADSQTAAVMWAPPTWPS
jgi:hypothetical protein